MSQNKNKYYYNKTYSKLRKTNKTSKTNICKNKNKNKSKNKSKNKRERTTTQKSFRGGKLYGTGTFGVVYGDPRLLCMGEKFKQVQENEVSKIYKDEEDATEEMSVVNRLTSKMSPDDFGKMQNYCLLPKKKCKVNRENTKTWPYKTDGWKKDDKGRYSSNTEIFNAGSELPQLKSRYTDMVIFEKGGRNLADIFDEIGSDEVFKTYVNNLTNILEGIQLLQKYGFIHGDLKDLNCILHEHQFKMIDMADVRDISTSVDSKSMPYAFGYYIWPSISMYTFFFERKQYKVGITPQLVKSLYTPYYDYNKKMYEIYLGKYLYKPLTIFTSHGFTQAEIKTITSIRNKLYSQKTLGFTTTLINKDTFPEFIKYLTQQPQQLTDFLTKYNRIFSYPTKKESKMDSNFLTKEESKMDLFKRIDIYSFGILLLSCISGFYKFKNNQLITKSTRNILMRCYRFVDKCCDQKDKVANIDELVEEYKQISIPTPAPAPVPAAAQKRGRTKAQLPMPQTRSQKNPRLGSLSADHKTNP